jgi:hypothetical protein
VLVFAHGAGRIDGVRDQQVKARGQIRRQRKAVHHGPTAAMLEIARGEPR